MGGNPDLSPETATTKTLGVILQPSFIPRLAFTVDWFNIKVKDAIQGFGADAILTQCIAGTTSLTSVDPACSLINRDAAGSIWLTPGGFVIDTPNNEGKVETSGFDFNGSYSHRLGGLGNLSATFLGTWLKHYKVDNGLTEPYDCAGLYGPICSGAVVASAAPMPKWRHKVANHAARCRAASASRCNGAWLARSMRRPWTRAIRLTARSTSIRACTSMRRIISTWPARSASAITIISAWA